MELILLTLIVAAVWLFISYNKLRQRAENVKRTQANVAATIKKRHDIAQRLSDIAASYGDHEKLTHFTVVEGDNSVAHAAAAAADASRVIGNVQMLANRFPELKASTTYQQLMVQLEEIESSILDRREHYNSAAQDYNTLRGSLPHLFYAAQMGFSEASYFTVDETGGELLANFKTDDGEILRASMQRMASAATSHAQSAVSKIKTASEQHRSNQAINGAKNGDTSERAE